MMTCKLTIRWPDGTAMEGVMSTASPDLSAPVRWEGDAMRLRARPDRLDGRQLLLGSFVAQATAHARQTGGVMQKDGSGEAETWAK